MLGEVLVPSRAVSPPIVLTRIQANPPSAVLADVAVARLLSVRADLPTLVTPTPGPSHLIQHAAWKTASQMLLAAQTVSLGDRAFAVLVMDANRFQRAEDRLILTGMINHLQMVVVKAIPAEILSAPSASRRLLHGCVIPVMWLVRAHAVRREIFSALASAITATSLEMEAVLLLRTVCDSSLATLA